MKKAIAIVGSGRTGTHWLASSMQSSGFALIGEDHPGFQLSIRAALGIVDPNDLVSEYRRDIIRQTERHIVFKWHPSLWCIGELISGIDELTFIAMVRNLDDTAKSMSAHAGTRRWLEEHQRYESNPRADAFLGRIDRPEFDKSSVQVRCMMRARSHAMEVQRVTDEHPGRILWFDYDAAVMDYRSSSCNLSNSLGVSVAINEPLPSKR
jgi:hypothetical protein